MSISLSKIPVQWTRFQPQPLKTIVLHIKLHQIERNYLVYNKVSCHNEGNDFLTRGYLKVGLYTDVNYVYVLIMQVYIMVFTALHAQTRAYKYSF